jgi:two-component system chemotaxis response regulator CheB
MPLRVLIVDDSAYHRRTLARIIGSDPTLEVVGTADNGEEAIKKVVSLKPDLVTTDLEMPRMDGFTFLRWLMRTFPRPVLVVSSRESNKSVFRALELGAADFVVKPVSYASERLAAIEGEVLAKIHQISTARAEKLAARAERLALRPEPAPGAPRKAQAAPPAGGRLRCVAIGASTGGPPALQQILAALPADFPAGILIAQHMPEGFTRMFADRLDRICALRVKEAEGGEEIAPGLALVAPGGRHLVAVRGPGGAMRTALEDAVPGDRFVPSVDRLIVSAAETCGERLVAVVLTGMGDDGVLGVRATRARGGLTMAESEESCVVYGMPREAVRTGAVQQVLPLPEIAAALVRECAAP